MRICLRPTEVAVLAIVFFHFIREPATARASGLGTYAATYHGSGMGEGPPVWGGAQ